MSSGFASLALASFPNLWPWRVATGPQVGALTLRKRKIGQALHKYEKEDLVL